MVAVVTHMKHIELLQWMSLQSPSQTIWDSSQTTKVQRINWSKNLFPLQTLHTHTAVSWAKDKVRVYQSWEQINLLLVRRRSCKSSEILLVNDRNVLDGMCVVHTVASSNMRWKWCDRQREGVKSDMNMRVRTICDRFSWLLKQEKDRVNE